MKGTQLVYRNEITIAPDGKTRTWRSTLFNPDGSVRVANPEIIHDRVGGAIDPLEPLIGHSRPSPSRDQRGGRRNARVYSRT